MARQVKSVGEVLRELREEAGLTLAALARLAKLDTATLTRIESEKRTHIRFTTVCQIASALDTSSDEIAIRAGLMKPRRAAAKRSDSARATALEGLTRVDSLLDQARKKIDRLKEDLS